MSADFPKYAAIKFLKQGRLRLQKGNITDFYALLLLLFYLFINIYKLYYLDCKVNALLYFQLTIVTIYKAQYNISAYAYIIEY